MEKLHQNLIKHNQECIIIHSGLINRLFWTINNSFFVESNEVLFEVLKLPYKQINLDS